MAKQIVHDPVCHMDIDLEGAAGSSEYDGKTYYFCSGGCKVDFDADPEGVLKAEAEYDHSQPVHMMMDEGATAASGATDSGTKKPWWQFWSS